MAREEPDRRPPFPEISQVESTIMVLQKYEANELFYNKNLFEGAGREGLFAYRGDLILVPGEVADAQGRRKPPMSVIRQVSLLADGEKLTLLTGWLEDLAEAKVALDLYAADCTSQTHVILFVLNITKAIKVSLAGVECEFIPMSEGVVWNELTDMLGLEKGDFKGQSAGEKVATVAAELNSHHSKTPLVSWEDALASIVAVKRVVRGAI